MPFAKLGHLRPKSKSNKKEPMSDNSVKASRQVLSGTVCGLLYVPLSAQMQTPRRYLQLLKFCQASAGLLGSKLAPATWQSKKLKKRAGLGLYVFIDIGSLCHALKWQSIAVLNPTRPPSFSMDHRIRLTVFLGFRFFDVLPSSSNLLKTQRKFHDNDELQRAPNTKLFSQLRIPYTKGWRSIGLVPMCLGEVDDLPGANLSNCRVRHFAHAEACSIIGRRTMQILKMESAVPVQHGD